MDSVIVKGGVSNQRNDLPAGGQICGLSALCGTTATKPFKEIFNIIHFILDLGKPILLIVNCSKQGQGGAAQISYGPVLFSKQSKCTHL